MQTSGSGYLRMLAGRAGAAAAASDFARARRERGAGEEVDGVQVAAVGEVMMAAEKYFKTCRTYQAGHPALERFFVDLEGRLRNALQRYDEVRIHLLPNGAQYDGEQVYKTDRVEHSMWFPLYRDGVRELAFAADLDRAELQRFFAVLVQLVHAPRGGDDDDEGEDDAVTLLWDGEFHGIEYVAVDGLAEGSGEGNLAGHKNIDRVREMITLGIAKDLGRADRTGLGRQAVGEVARRSSLHLSRADLVFLQAENLAALDELPATSREVRGELFKLGHQERIDLAANLGDDPQLVEKFVEAVLQALAARGAAAETVTLIARVQQFFEAIAGQGMWDRAARLLHQAAGAIDARGRDPFDFEVIEALDGAFSSPIAMTALMTALAVAEDEDQVEELLKLVRLLPRQAVPRLLALLGEVADRRRRRRLCEVIARWGVPVLQAAGEALPTCTGDLALDVLFLIRAVGGPRAVEALEQACRHPQAPVRAEALRRLLELAGAAAAEPRARAALGDPDPAVRRVGLDYIVTRRPAEALRLVKGRLGHEGFAHLEQGEKKRLFLAYALVAPAEAAPWLLDKLGQRNLLGRHDADDERAAAALALGQLRHGEARPLLEKLAHGRLVRTPVKEACAAALALLNAPAPHGSVSQQVAVDEFSAVPATYSGRAPPAPVEATRPLQPFTLEQPTRPQQAFTLDPPAPPPPAPAPRPAVEHSAGFRIDVTRRVELPFSSGDREPSGEGPSRPVRLRAPGAPAVNEPPAPPPAARPRHPALAPDRPAPGPAGAPRPTRPTPPPAPAPREASIEELVRSYMKGDREPDDDG